MSEVTGISSCQHHQLSASSAVGIISCQFAHWALHGGGGVTIKCEVLDAALNLSVREGKCACADVGLKAV